MLQFSSPHTIPILERRRALREGSWLTRQAPRAARSFVRQLWRELAIQDWIALVYLTALLSFCLAGDGPRRSSAIGYLLADLAVFATGVALSRGKILSGVAGALAYRVGLFGAVFGAFTQLQYVLPTARAVRVDAEIYAFDKAVFGFEPAEVFDRFVTTASVEWFSFFYFGYFFILAVHIFPFMFAVKNLKLLSELSFGIIALFCIGHLLYLVVPGYGPYQHLAGHFTRELDGPTWWRLVRATVDAGEVTARTDIFPSLHTAAPTFLALFSFRHRRVGPFRYTWLPMALFASQIVLSTMFLRWHYLIDVIAGLALATALSLLSARVAEWEATRRELLGRSEVWTAPWLGEKARPEPASRGEMQRRRDPLFTRWHRQPDLARPASCHVGRRIADASVHERTKASHHRYSAARRVRVRRARLPRQGGAGSRHHRA